MFEIGIGILILLALAKKGGKGPNTPDGGDTTKPPVVGFDPVPSGGTGPGAPLLPAPAPPGALGDTLTMSDDCKTVTVGNTWWEKSAMPAIVGLVESGHGAPIYTAEDAAKSVDALVRTVVHDDAAGCIDSAPWLDRYIKNHPIPTPKLTDAPGEHLARLKAWDDAWDAQFSAWATSHPEAFALFRQIGQTGVKLWLSNAGVTGSQGLDGTGSPGMTATDKTALRALGYSISPAVVELFQADWNAVNLYRYGLAWIESGSDIDDDNKMGPITRAAAAGALELQARNGPWLGLVAAAAEGG